LTLPDGSRAAEIVRIPFSGGDLLTTNIDGKPYVVFRHAVESLGLDYSGQFRKLQIRSWANRCDITTVAADGKLRTMVAVDVATFLMWLATVNETKVADSVRDTLIAYQAESADAIYGYWTKGGAINPRASDEQREHLADDLEIKRAVRKAAEAKLDLGVIEAMGSVVDPTWRESLARHTWAVYKGEAPAIEPENRMLMTQPYLLERGISKADLGSIASVFGKRVKAAYVAHHGREPEEVLAMLNGRERPVKGYYERDRHLFDAVFEQHYSHLVGPQQLEMGAA